MSAPAAVTAAEVAGRFSGSKGFGMPFGNVPSGNQCIRSTSTGTPAASSLPRIASKAGPATPFPALARIVSGRNGPGPAKPATRAA